MVHGTKYPFHLIHPVNPIYLIHSIYPFYLIFFVFLHP